MTGRISGGSASRIAASLFALALLASLPGAAQAETYHAVELSSGRVICRATVDDGIACHVVTRPRWVNLSRTGEATVRKNGSNTIPRKGDQFAVGLIPRNGQSWKKNGVRCRPIGKDSKTGDVGRRWGVRCSNGSHSFTLLPHRSLKTT